MLPAFGFACTDLRFTSNLFEIFSNLREVY